MGQSRKSVGINVGVKNRDLVLFIVIAHGENRVIDGRSEDRFVILSVFLEITITPKLLHLFKSSVVCFF